MPWKGNGNFNSPKVNYATIQFVNKYKDLPNPRHNENKVFIVKKSFWHARGLYYSDGKKWRKG